MANLYRRLQPVNIDSSRSFPTTEFGQFTRPFEPVSRLLNPGSLFFDKHKMLWIKLLIILELTSLKMSWMFMLLTIVITS